jgi:hypothetical protein
MRTINATKLTITSHLLNQSIGVLGNRIVRSFKFILQVGVEDSIVNAIYG